MRSLRLLLCFASLTSLGIGGLVACGDDDVGAAGDTLGDGGTSSGDATRIGTSGGTSGTIDAGVDAGPPHAAAIASATPVYLGQTATLDASESTGGTLTYAWTLMAAPAGSTVTSASLQNASTAKATFVPDVLGDYSVTLTVTGNGTTDSVVTKLIVIDASVFYFTEITSSDPAKPSTAALNTSNLHANDAGTGAALRCFSSPDGGFTDAVMESGNTGADWWEAPAGQPSKIAYSFTTFDASGNKTKSLFASSSTDTCATEAPALDAVAVGADGPDNYEIPRISPDGTRVAYLRTDAAGRTRMMTIGLDGKERHDLGPRSALVDGGGPDPDSGRAYLDTGTGPRPAWLDATTVMWSQELEDVGDWQVVKTTDANDQTPTVIMHCATRSPPNQVEMLPSGELLISQNDYTAVDAAGFITSLYVYKPGAGGACDPSPRDLSKITSTKGQSTATAFALSPDKTKVAFLQHLDTSTDYDVRVVPVDGSSPSVKVGFASTGALGPRWIAGGSALTWGARTTDVAGDFGANQNSAVVLARSMVTDAGPSVVASNRDGTLMAIGNCGMGYGFGSAASGAGFLGLLGLGLTRRRKQR